MTKVHTFVFNPFQENTLVVADDSGDCAIFDPGCYSAAEEKMLTGFIEKSNLRPVRLINTHCHLDHIFGNRFVAERYELPLEAHEADLPVLKMMPQIGLMYGLPAQQPSPEPELFLQDGDEVRFGNTILKVIFTPGHSPGGISFFCEQERFLIAGDVLFRGSIGRTDLPGGDYQTLIRSIKDKLLPLGDDVVVYSGHGPETTIGEERANNPFLNGEIEY
jgi:glyoxylase-like metal-dependent hydrolase (beta-lactamase superfamily II)